MDPGWVSPRSEGLEDGPAADVILCRQMSTPRTNTVIEEKIKRSHSGTSPQRYSVPEFSSEQEEKRLPVKPTK